MMATTQRQQRTLVAAAIGAHLQRICGEDVDDVVVSIQHLQLVAQAAAAAGLANGAELGPLHAAGRHGHNLHRLRVQIREAAARQAAQAGAGEGALAAQHVRAARVLQMQRQAAVGAAHAARAQVAVFERQEIRRCRPGGGEGTRANERTTTTKGIRESPAAARKVSVRSALPGSRLEQPGARGGLRCGALLRREAGGAGTHAANGRLGHRACRSARRSREGTA